MRKYRPFADGLVNGSNDPERAFLIDPGTERIAPGPTFAEDTSNRSVRPLRMLLGAGNLPASLRASA
jgi:hypothetical protein